MKIYKELCFYGSEEDFRAFANGVSKYIPSDWGSPKINPNADQLVFAYLGLKEEPAHLYLCKSKYQDKPCYRVTNIVPTKVNDLSIEQYNRILDIFYRDIITPYVKDGIPLQVDEPTSDRFDPLTVISEEALSKLAYFSNMANKSTGYSHPCDMQRWFDFICQTVEDGRIFDIETLANFLQDKEYWGTGKAGTGFSSTWTEDMAWELASNYEMSCDLLQYYRGEGRF